MKSLNEQINPTFVAQARKLTFYTGLLREILPVECIDHVQVANVRNQNLMLITDSPVWTTRLRQLSPQILQHIRQYSSSDHYSGSNAGSDQAAVTGIIHHVQISTRYQTPSQESMNPASSKKRPLPTISEQTAEILQQSAESIDDPQLKTALLNLARHKDEHKK